MTSSSKLESTSGYCTVCGTRALEAKGTQGSKPNITSDKTEQVV